MLQQMRMTTVSVSYTHLLETGADVSLFEGLYIAENKALCDEYMGKYPVIFLSLKSVEGLNFEAAKYRITELIGREAQRFDFLLERDVYKRQW